MTETSIVVAAIVVAAILVGSILVGVALALALSRLARDVDRYRQ